MIFTPKSQGISAFWQEARQNRRFLLGLLVIMLIVLAEGGLRWRDHLVSREKQLNELRARQSLLRRQSRDEAALRARLADFREARQAAEKRMWIVSSDAVGQAWEKDWLQRLFKDAQVVPMSITLAAPRDPAQGSAAATGKEASPTEAQGIREFRSTLVFPFSPDSLEKMLARFEGGDPFPQVDSLVVNRRDRRVELTLRLLMDVDKARAAAASEKDTGRDAEETKGAKETERAEKTSPPMPKNE